MEESVVRTQQIPAQIFVFNQNVIALQRTSMHIQLSDLLNLAHTEQRRKHCLSKKTLVMISYSLAVLHDVNLQLICRAQRSSVIMTWFWRGEGPDFVTEDFPLS